ncbi:MAG TPA: ASCH domain-containing protein [Bosea sp. (in: a-proteobacteria)]|jgi:uncharacterized protein YhfF|nr:ASCH domain-containing protein [Bosea sp. (in: a-proteobacteria)]
MSTIPERYRDCPSFSFGDSPELATELAALVVSGRKTATVNTQDAPDCPKLGELWIVLDGQKSPVCVIETLELTPRRFEEVDAQFAFEEGEGDRSLAFWREAHEAYFRRLGVFSPDMTLLCERFRLVEVFASMDATA